MGDREIYGANGLKRLNVKNSAATWQQRNSATQVGLELAIPLSQPLE